MNQSDMEQDLTQEVEILKISIETLSKNIDENFNALNKNLSLGFEQITKQIINLSNQGVLDNEVVNDIRVNNDQVSLSVPKKPLKTPDEYLIDYPYIDEIQYSDWVRNLKNYSKDMAESRKKKNIPNFCKSANDILESAIEVLFQEEFNYLSESNKKFLEAYERSKEDRIKRGWDFTEICIKNSSKIESKDFKKLDDKYISWNSIEKICNRDFNHSLDIFFEILIPNFMNTPHLRKKYFLIKGVHILRSFVSHGTSSNLYSKLEDKKNNHAKSLYYDRDNYTNIKEVVSWFVQEAYKRINELKTTNQFI